MVQEIKKDIYYRKSDAPAAKEFVYLCSSMVPARESNRKYVERCEKTRRNNGGKIACSSLSICSILYEFGEIRMPQGTNTIFFNDKYKFKIGKSIN